MDKHTIIDELSTKYGYDFRGAVIVANKLEKLNPQLASLFMQWRQDGVIPQIEIEGFTIPRLITEHDMKPIAAFLTLDWLLREPLRAIASLKKGKDHIIRNN